MEIIIYQNGTSRTLKGSFEVYGNRFSLRRIANQILRNTDSEEFHGGWIEIHDEIERQGGEIPLDWDAMGPSSRNKV